jgi:plastocyanin
MKNNPSFAVRCARLLLPIALLASLGMAADKKPNAKYACAEPDPAAMCTPANTCGSASTPCVVDVKRTANSASATPSIPGAKGNSTFCVKAGTTVVWKSTSKNVGFVVDVSEASPFDPSGAIIGGSDREVTTVAKRPGCFKYSAGACVSGAIYGMCASANAEVIVIP